MLLLKQVLTTLTYLHNKKPGPESRLLEDGFFSYGYLDAVFSDRVRVQQLIKSTVRLAAQKLSNPDPAPTPFQNGGDYGGAARINWCEARINY